MDLLETLKIVYKFPTLRPIEINAKRTRTSERVDNPLALLKALKLVQSHLAHYTITDLGKWLLQEFQEGDDGI